MVGLGHMTLKTFRQNAAGKRHLALLIETMQRHHALVTRDVALARGPLIDGWAHELRLAPVDKARLCRALEGSAEQTSMLASLDGAIDEARALRFAGSFYRVAERALGPGRMHTIAGKAQGRFRNGRSWSRPD